MPLIGLITVRLRPLQAPRLIPSAPDHLEEDTEYQEHHLMHL